MVIENISNSPNRIYKVWHTIEKNGKNIGHHISDLQFDEGVPYAVFEWLRTFEGEIPSIRVPLDPKYLHKWDRPFRQKVRGKWVYADYLYEWPVVWPE